ncbi:hypothetical protein LY76DRAFT_594145 [Colletotrichum caudatum]|nr:hypothetical protein LY76DRAFT_594145 [Colletotrichum caudatum]
MGILGLLLCCRCFDEDEDNVLKITIVSLRTLRGLFSLMADLYLSVLANRLRRQAAVKGGSERSAAQRNEDPHPSRRQAIKKDGGGGMYGLPIVRNGMYGGGWKQISVGAVLSPPVSASLCFFLGALRSQDVSAPRVASMAFTWTVRGHIQDPAQQNADTASSLLFLLYLDP